MITSKEFANALRKIPNNERYTTLFERKDVLTGKVYTQKKNRWWDKSTGSQREHVICWFARKNYKNNQTYECIKENYPLNCQNCYFVDKKAQYINLSYECNAKKVYDNLSRPEMYIWIVEVLEIISEEKLCELIKEIKGVMDNIEDEHHTTMMSKIRGIVDKKVGWEAIECKIKEILNNKLY